MTLQYAPTKNLSQILRAEDCEVFEFESEVLLAYYDRLSNYLNQHGYESVAELKEDLSRESIEELTRTIAIVDATADERSKESMLPEARPEDSFNSLVGAYTARAVLFIIKSVIADKKRNTEVKMYRPTMNLNRAFKEGGEVIEAYTLEGQKEGRKRFEARLKREGYASVEDWEKALRTEPHLDLLFYAMSLEEELAGWKRQAFDPNISPEESFDCMADAFHIIEGIRVIDKIVGGHERFMLRYNPSEEM